MAQYRHTNEPCLRVKIVLDYQLKNEVSWNEPCLRVKIVLDYQLKNEVSWNDFNTK